MKAIINTQVNKGNEAMTFNINGKIISDNKNVADSFNQYFTTVAQKLLDKLGPSTNHFTKYLANPNSESFFLYPVAPEEVNYIIANLEENKSYDSYNIPPKLIKMDCGTISKPFAIIANSSFSPGVFPEKLKFAKSYSHSQRQI